MVSEIVDRTAISIISSCHNEDFGHCIFIMKNPKNRAVWKGIVERGKGGILHRIMKEYKPY